MLAPAARTRLQGAGVVCCQQAGLQVPRPDQAGQLVRRLHLCYGEARGVRLSLHAGKVKDLRTRTALAAVCVCVRARALTEHQQWQQQTLH